MYGRKGNKQSSKKKWAKVKETEVDSIKLHIPLYLKSISDRKYLKDFENYLNTEHWKSVIDNSKPQIKRLHNHGIPVN